MTCRLRAVALGLLLLAASACEETDPNLVVAVGLTQLVVLDSSLRVQSVDPAVSREEAPIQVAQARIESALLFVQENVVDLAFGEACVFTDAAPALVPDVEGQCGQGVVLGGTSAPIEVSLLLRVRTTFARAEPVPWETHGADYDGDAVVNEQDNCPLLANSDQADGNRDGIGDTCTRLDPATGLPTRDSDGDGAIDRLDNCVWRTNPDQANTTGVGTEAGTSDGIGDACEEQLATIPSEPLELMLGPIPFQQPVAGRSFLVVDFNSRESLRDCIWSAGGPPGPCTFVDAVDLCTSTSTAVLLTGCL